MSKIAFILLLIIQYNNALCQQQKYAYDNVVKKLSAHSWWYDKFCKNDTCHQYKESAYFEVYQTFELDKRYKDDLKIKTNKHILCTEPATMSRQKDIRTDSFAYGVVFDLIPAFCFIDSNAANNTYQMFTLGEDGLYRAEMIFLSENEFYVKRIDTTDNKNNIQKLYFRLRGSKD